MWCSCWVWDGHLCIPAAPLPDLPVHQESLTNLTFEHLCGSRGGHKCDQRAAALLLQRQRELGLFKWMLWGDLRTAFQHLKGSYTKEGEWLFTWADSDRTRQKSFKLEEGRFRFDNWKKFFTVRLLRHWNKLPRETEDASSLDVFKLRSLRNLI